MHIALIYVYTLSLYDTLGTEGTDCEIEIITTPAPFCEPSDDCDGHYDCTDAGEIVCLAGWQNEDNDCKVTQAPYLQFVYSEQ